MLDSSAERSALGAAPGVARWLERSESKSLTAESHEQKKKKARASSPHKNPVSILHDSFTFRTSPKSDGRNLIRIIISLKPDLNVTTLGILSHLRPQLAYILSSYVITSLCRADAGVRPPR